jgi:hypothetical protein
MKTPPDPSLIGPFAVQVRCFVAIGFNLSLPTCRTRGRGQRELWVGSISHLGNGHIHHPNSS